MDQALRRKGQREQDLDVVAPSTGTQQHVPIAGATAPSDLRFDVPTGAHNDACQLYDSTSCSHVLPSLQSLRNADSLNIFTVCDSCSALAGADPSSDELRERLHDRIEVLFMPMATSMFMIEVLLGMSLQTSQRSMGYRGALPAWSCSRLG